MGIDPDLLRYYLNTSINNAVSSRTQHSDNFRNFTRNRKLPMETMMKLLLGMSGGSLAKELYFAGIDATPGAFVQQRHKIAPSAFQSVMRDFNRYSLPVDDLRYKGYRLLALDGSTISTPLDRNSESFLAVPTHPDGGYCAQHINPLFDLLNNTYYDCVIQAQSRMDEVGGLIQLLYQTRFPDKTLIIMDRAYGGYNALCHCINCPNVDFLVRLRHGSTAMTPIKALPWMEFDRDISFTLTTSQSKEHKELGYILMQTSNNSGHKNRPRWDFGHINPYPVAFRVVRFKLPTGEYETLATSLPRNLFSMDELKMLYFKRWQIETSFLMLKHRIGLVNLHGKSDDFALQEIYAGLTMYNFASRIARQAIIKNRRENIYEYRVNMTMAIQLAKNFFRTPSMSGKELIDDISRYVVPVRPGRQDERKNLKRDASFRSFVFRVAA